MSCSKEIIDFEFNFLQSEKAMLCQFCLFSFFCSLRSYSTYKWILYFSVMKGWTYNREIPSEVEGRNPSIPSFLYNYFYFCKGLIEYWSYSKTKLYKRLYAY